MDNRNLKRNETSPIVSLSNLAVAGTRFEGLTYALMWSLGLCFFWYLARSRFVDADEGFYLYAGVLVAKGKTPYVDFFYQQMPFLPYLNAAWMTLTGWSWWAGRGLSCVFAASTGALVFWGARRMTQSRLFALAAATLFVCSPLYFFWAVTAKTYAASAFFLLLGYALHTKAMDAEPGSRRRDLCLVCAGAAVTMATAVRLFFVVAFAAFILDFFLNGRKDARVRECGVFLMGACAAALPVFFLFLREPDAFWFNNVQYHALRGNYGFIGDIDQKIDTMLSLLGIKESLGNASRQAWLLLITAGIYMGRCVRRKVFPLAASITLLMCLVNLLPTPTFTQYFSVVVPFLVLMSVAGLHVVGQAAALQRRAQPLLVGLALAAFVLCYALLSRNDIAVTVDKSRTNETYIEDIERAVALLDRTAPPDALVINNWPGFFVAARQRAFPGLENQFALSVGNVISEERRRRLHILKPEELFAFISEGEHTVILLDYLDHIARMTGFGYELRGVAGKAGIFARPSVPWL